MVCEEEAVVLPSLVLARLKYWQGTASLYHWRLMASVSDPLCFLWCRFYSCSLNLLRTVIANAVAKTMD
jgi:hypothetical protein